MQKTDLEKKYSSLLKDMDFNRLYLLRKQPNIFIALGVSKYEIRHSNFLAWLLNPKESHGLGDLFLIRFLREIFLDERCTTISLIELPDLNLAKTVIFREWNNIDLLIQVENIVIAIENKFYSTEHSNQLKRYKEEVEQHFKNEIKLYVYLSPYGEESSDNTTYINYSYQSIVDILTEILELYKNSLSLATCTYIADYINAIKLLVMENSEANEMALKIYKNHKELFDFIYELKPDNIRAFDDELREYIESKGYVLGSQHKGCVRFLTKELNEIIPKGYSKGWPQKESFLFELVNWSDKKISLKAVVAPGDEEARAILSDALKTVEGAQKPSGAQWLTYYQLNLPVNYTMLTDYTKDSLYKKLDNEWPKVKAMVDKVSLALLNRKDELSTLINKRLDKHV